MNCQSADKMGYSITNWQRGESEDKSVNYIHNLTIHLKATVHTYYGPEWNIKR